MPSCTRCNQTVDSQAVICPHCKNTLKAFGHPGIPLYQAEKDNYLCDRCTYHEDDSCNYPQRPHAKTCTLFRDVDATFDEDTFIDTRSLKSKIIGWCSTNKFLLGILFLLCLSIMLTV